MARLRRRSWYQPRSQRSDSVRLFAMIALLIVVVLMAFFAQRSEVWSGLFPDPDHAGAAKTGSVNVHSPSPDAANSQSKKSTLQTIELVPIEQSAPRPKQPEDHGTRWMMGGLLLVTIAYFGWRIYSIARRFSRRAAPETGRLLGRRMWLPDEEDPKPAPEPPLFNTDREPNDV